MNNQKISNELTRENYKNEKFCHVTKGNNKNNDECIAFHTKQRWIKSDKVLLLENMR